MYALLLVLCSLNYVCFLLTIMTERYICHIISFIFDIVFRFIADFSFWILYLLRWIFWIPQPTLWNTFTRILSDISAASLLPRFWKRVTVICMPLHLPPSYQPISSFLPLAKSQRERSNTASDVQTLISVAIRLWHP